MNNKVSSLSLSLSLSYQYRKEERTGLIAPPNRLPKGGLRRSDFGQMLSDFGGDPRG